MSKSVLLNKNNAIRLGHWSYNNLYNVSCYNMQRPGLYIDTKQISYQLQRHILGGGQQGNLERRKLET